MDNVAQSDMNAVGLKYLSGAIGQKMIGVYREGGLVKQEVIALTDWRTEDSVISSVLIYGTVVSFGGRVLIWMVTPKVVPYFLFIIVLKRYMQ